MNIRRRETHIRRMLKSLLDTPAPALRDLCAFARRSTVVSGWHRKCMGLHRVKQSVSAFLLPSCGGRPPEQFGGTAIQSQSTDPEGSAR